MKSMSYSLKRNLIVSRPQLLTSEVSDEEYAEMSDLYTTTEQFETPNQSSNNQRGEVAVVHIYLDFKYNVEHHYDNSTHYSLLYHVYAWNLILAIIIQCEWQFFFILSGARIPDTYSTPVQHSERSGRRPQPGRNTAY